MNTKQIGNEIKICKQTLIISLQHEMFSHSNFRNFFAQFNFQNFNYLFAQILGNSSLFLLHKVKSVIHYNKHIIIFFNSFVFIFSHLPNHSKHQIRFLNTKKNNISGHFIGV